jgi:hypothetical protein
LQGRLSPADTKLLWISGIFGVIVIVVSAFLSPVVQENNSPVPSSYSADPDGALAAYLLLSDLHYPVRRWQQGPALLTANPEESVLILAEPSASTSSADRKALLDFVSSGGRVLFCGPTIEAFFPLPATKPTFTLAPATIQAGIPSAYSRGADTISIRARAQWEASDAKSLRLYGEQAKPAVVVASLGQGEVLWWSAATPLTNLGISEADNLRLFLNAVSNADGTPRTVYWDEYFHGEQGSLWDYIAKTPIPWGLWQLALVAVILVFAFSRRSGPIVLPSIRSRLSPLEFVDTMGELYSRAGAASVAVEVPYRRLRLDLSRRLGRPSTATDLDLAREAAKRLSLPEAEVYATLHAADEASRAPKLAPKNALELVQQLVRYTRQLKTPQVFQEKKP